MWIWDHSSKLLVITMNILHIMKWIFIPRQSTKSTNKKQPSCKGDIHWRMLHDQVWRVDVPSKRALTNSGEKGTVEPLISNSSQHLFDRLQIYVNSLTLWVVDHSFFILSFATTSLHQHLLHHLNIPQQCRWPTHDIHPRERILVIPSKIKGKQVNGHGLMSRGNGDLLYTCTLVAGVTKSGPTATVEGDQVATMDTLIQHQQHHHQRRLNHWKMLKQHD